MVSFRCIIDGSALGEFTCFLEIVLLRELRRKLVATCDTVAWIGEFPELLVLMNSLDSSSSIVGDGATVIFIISGEAVWL